MISYADIQSIYRNEKNIPILQIIPEDFYSQANMLAENLEGEHKTHLTNLLEEIILRRRNKIVLHALRMTDEIIEPTNINPLEESFFKNVSSEITQFKGEIMKTEPKRGKNDVSIDEPKEEAELVSVRIIKPIPEIVGSDAKSYGPFKTDDIVKIPRENADILVKHEAAVEIEGD